MSINLHQELEDAAARVEVLDGDLDAVIRRAHHRSGRLLPLVLSRANAARRGRRCQRIVGLCGVVALAVLGATAVPALLDRGDGGVELAAGDEKDAFKPGWTRLSDPPLSPRSRATSAWTGKEIVVVGGSIQRCVPVASCVPRTDSPVADGAAFDIEDGTWRTIKPSPVPLEGQRAAVLDGDVYVLAPCGWRAVEGEKAAPCEIALLRYRSAGDTWDVLPAPSGLGFGQEMVAAAGGLFALGGGEDGQARLSRFDTASSTWSEVLGYPTHLSTQTQLLADGDDIVVFGQDVKPGGTSTMESVVGARLATKAGTWSAFPSGRGSRVLPQVVDGLVILQPTAGRAVAEGGTLELAGGAWRPFPEDQAGRIPVQGRLGVGPLAGAVGSRGASFASTSGHVFDTAAQTWVRLDPVDPRTDESIASFGRHLFSFGGSRLPGYELLNDAWVWAPPAAAGATTPTLMAQDPVPAPVPSADPVSPAPTSAPPAPAPTPGAPVFVSATGDATAGRVTVRFDRPVTGDKVDTSPGPKTFSPDKTQPMNMIVFGPDRACSGPRGNGHDYVSGLGTDTVTIEATSLAAGTTYLGIGRGVVKSVADGTFNDAVVVKDLPTTTFVGMSCIPIKVSGTVPTTTPYTDPAGGPELLSATATSGAGAPPPAPGTGAGRITLKFDKPVVPGDGPNFDGRSPNLQPADGGNSMRAMQLVVHTTDSSCSSSSGNAHAYLAGVGTGTLTVDATSLVVGTTYISIGPGFAKAKADGTAMRWVRCFALTVAS